MEETTSTDIQDKKRFEALKKALGAAYVIGSDGIAVNEEHALDWREAIIRKRLPKKSIFSRRHSGPVATIRGLAEPRSIEVFDEGIYPLMKAFGDEQGYLYLVKCWEGAEDGGQERPKQPMKVISKSETIEPRYKQIKREEDDEK